MHTHINKQFNIIFEKAKQTDVWKSMMNTVEDSPWHREASVAVHTEMVLAAYDEHFAHKRTARQVFMTKLALLGHDFGKPTAEETISDDRGTRRRYAGHELISANSFQDFILSDQEVFSTVICGEINMDHLRAIKFMIEHHLPYDMGGDKLALFKMNLIEMLGDDWIIFTDMVTSDCLGRISDDHQSKIEKVLVWTEMFNSIEPPEKSKVKDGAPTMFVLLGASGSGKTTYVKSVLGGLQVYSLDDLRVKMFTHTNPNHNLGESELYHKAWEFCNMNSSDFTKFATESLGKIIRTRESFVLDNTNTSRKGRRAAINQARQAGYTVVSVEFKVPLSTVLERQKTRGDKSVPHRAVVQQYMGIQLPWLSATTTNKHGKNVDVVGSEIDIFTTYYAGNVW